MTIPPPGKPPPPPSAVFMMFSSLTFSAYTLIVDLLVYNQAFPGFFRKDGMKEIPDMGIMILAYIVAGIVFTFAYITYGRTLMRFTNPFSEAKTMSIAQTGATFGIVAALLIFLPASIFDMALFEGRNWAPNLADVGYRIVQFAIGGIIVAKIDKAIFKYDDYNI